MRAIVCHRLTPDRTGLAVEPTWPEPPPPAAGEVLVALSHAALNYPDLLMLSGGYQFAPPLPFIPGIEGTGTVIAVGQGVDAALLGREVILGARCGLLAERVIVPAGAVRSRPLALAPAAAAAFTVTALTAYVALVRRGRLIAGERVAVAGAGGGTGLAAVALAKAIGATVVALASSPAKEAAARAAGADDVHLVSRGTPVLDLPTVDVVFDPVGGALTAPLLAALNRSGRYLIVGFIGGVAAPAFDQISAHEVELIGVRAGEFGRHDPAGGIANLAAIDRLAAQLIPAIGLEVPLAGAATAFRAMAEGTLTGKAIVDLR